MLIKEDVLEEMSFTPGLKEDSGLGGGEMGRRSRWRETEATERLSDSLLGSWTTFLHL